MWNWDNDAKVKRDGPPLAQTDIYFVTFDTCYSSFCSHWVTHAIKIITPLLLADTVCHTSHSLLLLVQLSKLVTTAHEQTAIERAAGWKLKICQFERGVAKTWQQAQKLTSHTEVPGSIHNLTRSGIGWSWVFSPCIIWKQHISLIGLRIHY